MTTGAEAPATLPEELCEPPKEEPESQHVLWVLRVLLLTLSWRLWAL